VDLARFLAATDTLRYFDLRWNKVGVVGARAVAQALAHNTSVGIVNLRENRCHALAPGLCVLNR
jgi:hypothetical protein